MIFVTVGTHEQQFNRLIEEVDLLANEKIITEKIVFQVGYSTYRPRNGEVFDFMTFDQVKENILNSRIIICHGGPSTFLEAVSCGKVPIVVPRQKKYHEHVNNHQVDFCHDLVDRKFPIIVLDNVKDMKKVIQNYDDNKLILFQSHTSIFVSNLLPELENLFK
jgi:UDP-N-acetylglucosamine transferase subunit ALG13